MSIVEPEVSYASKQVSHGTYQFSKSVPQVALDSLDSVPSTSTAETTMELPARVFNLGKSYLSFTAKPTATADSGYKWMHADGSRSFLLWNSTLKTAYNLQTL
jgi:hypothetical protein